MNAPPPTDLWENPINMNPQWKTFLESRSAKIDDQGNVTFPGAPHSAECALCDLSRLALIAVTGADAEHFLQGQLTNDVRELSATHTQLSAACSPKGRILTAFRALRLDDTIYLQLPRTKLEATLQRLRMFVLRAQVRLEVADDLVVLGLAGACADALLATDFDALPALENDVARRGTLTAIRMAGATPRFQVVGPTKTVADLWDRLAPEATVVNPDYWRLLDIRAGIPSVYPETTDAFVPQMVNLQHIDGVSFTKGCYTGQEIVARMQYLGKLKRRMYRAEVTADTAPRPGDELHSATSSSEQAAGRIVDVCPTGGGRYELLAVVEIAAAEADDVRLGADGPRLSLAEPPYGFDARA